MERTNKVIMCCSGINSPEYLLLAKYYKTEVINSREDKALDRKIVSLMFSVPSGSVSIHQTSQPEEPIPLFNPLDNPHLHFHDGSAVKNLPAMQEMFNPWVGEIPWRRE